MAEPVLAHLSLIPRVFSLSEMWAPHLFSYMALSGLSFASENSEVLMESTQLAISATFGGLSEASHSFNSSWKVRRRKGTSPQVFSVQRIIFISATIRIHTKRLPDFLLALAKARSSMLEVLWLFPWYLQRLTEQDPTPRQHFCLLHTVAYEEFQMYFASDYFQKNVTLNVLHMRYVRSSKKDIKVKNLTLGFVYLRAWLVDIFFLARKTAQGHSPFLQCYCLVG